MQVVHVKRSNVSGISVLAADLHTENWQVVEMRLPADAAMEGPEIRPVDRPAVIEVREISLHSDTEGVLWMAQTVPDLQRVRTVGTLRLLPGKDRCLFFNFGVDPLWVLPPLKESNTPVMLKAVLRIHADFETVSNAVDTAHAQIYLMAAQVRSASADRNRILREFRRRTGAAEAESAALALQLEAGQGSALRKIQEQALRIAEAQAQNDSLASQLKELQAHHEKLLQQILHMEGSRSWRVTRPLRSASTLARKLKKS